MWDFIQRVLRVWAEHNADIVICRRVRLTIAEVNAGLTPIVPVIAGHKLRLVDAYMISVGGAAAAATTVDIVATLSGSARKLMAAAVANLTQSAILRIGGTGGTALADGASFTANDTSTAIIASKTGGDITTATHIDFVVRYVLEKF